MSSPIQAYNWRFFRAGGFNQVRLSSGADLMNLDKLDQKLWVALACPTTGLEIDSRTLQLVDTDKDGRVRAPELIAAVKWAGSRLKNPNDLIMGGESMPLSAINDAEPIGKILLAAAKKILTSLGKGTTDTISPADTQDATAIYIRTVLNGDGIVIRDTAADESLKLAIDDIIATVGSELDRSGKPGINQAKIDRFFDELAAYQGWFAKSESEATAIQPLGAATAAAGAAYQAIKSKIDDYFGRCRLMAFDSRAAAAVNREEKDYLPLSIKELSIDAKEVGGFPLAQIAAGKPLPLTSGINPAWAASLSAFVTSAVVPFLGERTELSEGDWAQIGSRLSGYLAWLAGKPATTVEKLGIERIRQLLAGKTREQLTALVAEDKAEEAAANSIDDVDRLVRYYRDLGKLCRNFVNFEDFYSRKEKAIFQAGVLYLDQRSCELCIEVVDAAKHGSMAPLAGTYFAYVDCVRKGTAQKKSILVAFTGGDADNLMVGRNGLFYDRKGVDYDATIVKIIENPISIRQAFFSPYKKLVRFIEEQVAKRAAAADTEANAKLAQVAEVTANADKAAAKESKKVDIGSVAAIGVAMGSLGTAFGYFAKTFADVSDWQIPLLLMALVMVISGPSMLIAFLKLRKRSLGPILDANGWAVNAKAGMTVPFGGALTATATIPPEALLDAGDKFAEKRSLWPKVALAVFLIWWLDAYVVGAKHLDKAWYQHPIESWKAEKNREAEEVAAKRSKIGGTNSVTSFAGTFTNLASVGTTNGTPAKP